MQNKIFNDLNIQKFGILNHNLKSLPFRSKQQCRLSVGFANQSRLFIFENHLLFQEMGCTAQKPKTVQKEIKQSELQQEPSQNILETIVYSQDLSEFYNYRTDDLNSLDKRDFKVYSKKSNEHRLAMKITIPTDQIRKKNLEHKLHTMLQLDHNGLERCHEIFQHNHDYILIKDYPDGISLTEHIVKSQLKVPQIAELFQSILQIVNFLHQRKLIHGNLKSDNILIQAKQNVPYPKIFQLGLAFEESEWERHNLRSPISDLLCRSPEVIKGRFEVGSDIWSLGILLYFTLTGIMPFDGPDKKRVKSNILKGTLDVISSHWEELSDPCKELIKCMVKYAPSHRPTALECLNNKWFKTYKKTHIGEKEKKKISASLLRIDKFHTDNKLQSAILMALVNNAASQKEQGKLLKLFQKMDKDNDGVLSKEELYNGFSQIMGEDEARAEVDHVFQLFDVDNHNEIDYREFLTAFSKKKHVTQKSEIQTVFKQADHDGNGTLSILEIKRLLIKADCSDEEVQQMFQQWDVNNDGEITFEEFFQGVNSMRSDQSKSKASAGKTPHSQKSRTIEGKSTQS